MNNISIQLLFCFFSEKCAIKPFFLPWLMFAARFHFSFLIFEILFWNHNLIGIKSYFLDIFKFFFLRLNNFLIQLLIFNSDENFSTNLQSKLAILMSLHLQTLKNVIRNCEHISKSDKRENKGHIITLLSYILWHNLVLKVFHNPHNPCLVCWDCEGILSI